jgi:hypothetical protein
MRNHATYKAGSASRSRIVATNKPPMSATAIGAQKWLWVSGISARIAAVDRRHPKILMPW